MRTHCIHMNGNIYGNMEIFIIVYFSHQNNSDLLNGKTKLCTGLKTLVHQSLSSVVMIDHFKYQWWPSNAIYTIDKHHIFHSSLTTWSIHGQPIESVLKSSSPYITISMGYNKEMKAI